MSWNFSICGIFYYTVTGIPKKCKRQEIAKEIMKAIICDDEKSTCSELETLLLKYAEEKKIRLTVEVCYSGEELLKDMEKEDIDILFLDIELPGENGVSVGEYIRNVMENENAAVIPRRLRPRRTNLFRICQRLHRALRLPDG